MDWRSFWFQPYSQGSPFSVLAKNTLIAFSLFVIAAIPLHIFVYFFQEEYFRLANSLFVWMYGILGLSILAHKLKVYRIGFFIMFMGGEVYLYYISSYFGRDSLLYLLMIFNTLVILVVLGREKRLAVLSYLTLSVFIIFGHFTDFRQFYNPETEAYQALLSDYTIIFLLSVNFLIVWNSIQKIHKSQKQAKIAKEEAEELLEKRMHMETLLHEKNLELQKYIDSNLQLENFAYAASHDLKEPIRTITSFSQLLMRRYEPQLDRDGKEYLSYIVHAGFQMNELIRDMLEFARVNTEAGTLDTIRPKELIQDVLLHLQSQIQENEASIRLGSLPAEIIGDVSKLRQLFQNLINNGIKFQKKGEIPAIDISGREIDTGWEFAVADNGIGIRKEFQSKVFLIFRRLHDKGLYGGSGIGLAICKKVVEQHSGKIWIESTEGTGTKVCFTLSHSPLNMRYESSTPSDTPSDTP